MIIYDRYQGFMARCCSYEVAAPKLYIFEKHLGYINIEKPIDGGKDKFILKDNEIIYKYELGNLKYGKQVMKMRDTTEILNFE